MAFHAFCAANSINCNTISFPFSNLFCQLLIFRIKLIALKINFRGAVAINAPSHCHFC